MIATWFRGAAVGALLVLGACLAGPASAAEPGDLQAEVRQAVETYIAAVMSNDPAKLAPLLAPEFQILRADGTNYDAKSYPASSLPIIAEMPVIERLNVTANGDIAVASFYVNINQTRDGVVVQRLRAAHHRVPARRRQVAGGGLGQLRAAGAVVIVALHPTWAAVSVRHPLST